MEQGAKIYISGHAGLIGSALVRLLQERGYRTIITRTRKELDLTDQPAVAAFFATEKPDYVFVPSYKSGSIQANIKQPAEFIYENLVAQNNVIHNAYRVKVKKMVIFNASCVYPKDSPQPIKEEALLAGKPEETSQAYTVAKISEIIMAQAYNKQYGTNFVSVVPATLYGPGDEFSLERSHVLSAMIRRFHEAKLSGKDEITLWGSGTPRREFLHVDDAAAACLFLMERDETGDLLNLGVGSDISIKELAELIKAVTGFEGRLSWDTSKPDGVKQKLLDSSRLEALGWKHKIALEIGVRMAYQWFTEHYSEIVEKETTAA